MSAARIPRSFRPGLLDDDHLTTTSSWHPGHLLCSPAKAISSSQSQLVTTPRSAVVAAWAARRHLAPKKIPVILLRICLSTPRESMCSKMLPRVGRSCLPQDLAAAPCNQHRVGVARLARSYLAVLISPSTVRPALTHTLRGCQCLCATAGSVRLATERYQRDDGDRTR